MAPLIRRRMVCFYCSCRSAQWQTGNLRQWKCETCDSVNFLDENGDITDPPSQTTPKVNVRYAQAIERPELPVFTSPDDTLFCRHCINNQQILTQSLASYQPPPALSEREEDNAISRYRKTLEESFPQVCATCEPRVRERIQATGYAAKTDHLRRMMERSRGVTTSRYKWDWRHVVVYAGAVAWCVALSGQILWNTLGSLTPISDGLADGGGGTQSVVGCVRQTFRNREAGYGCTQAAYPSARWAIIIGLLSSWWNPCLSSSLRSTGGNLVGHMVGLTEFYCLQAILYAVRLGGLYVFGNFRDFQLDSANSRAIHAVLLVFNVAVSVVSYRAARVIYTPRVTFEENYEPLIPTNGMYSRSRSISGSLTTPPRASTQPFPINNLAPASRHNDPPPYQAPTPPPDNDVDEMDWTPVKTEFKTQFKPIPTLVHQSTPKRPEPSPFYGKLPEAPISQNHRLRNPPTYNKFRKASETAQENFFKSVNRTSKSKEETSNQDSSHEMPDSPRRMEIAQPRFFAPVSNDRMDTGLESLFTNIFSLSDGSPVKKPDSERREQDTIRDKRPSAMRIPWQRLVSTLLLSFACWAWLNASRYSAQSAYLRFGALGIEAVIAGRGLIEVVLDKEHWRSSDMLLLGVELAVAVGLGYVVRSIDHRGERVAATVESFALWFLGVMLFQEVCTLISEIVYPTSAISTPLKVPLSDHAPSLDRKPLPTQMFGSGSSSSTPSPPRKSHTFKVHQTSSLLTELGSDHQVEVWGAPSTSYDDSFSQMSLKGLPQFPSSFGTGAANTTARPSSLKRRTESNTRSVPSHGSLAGTSSSLNKSTYR